MSKEYFTSFEAAKEMSIQLATTFHLTVKWGRSPSGFFVELPFEYIENDQSVAEEKVFSGTEDYDELERRRELQEEMEEWQDCQELSNDSGWFYPDSDSGYENNIVDPACE